MTLEIGHDGHKPQFEKARDVDAFDRWTGRRKRESIDGPENVNSTRIRALHIRKRLTDRQAAAADRYQNDYQLALMIPTASAGATTGGGGIARSTLPDAKLDAMTRHAKARKAMGSKCAAVVDLVALENNLVEVVASILHIHHQKAAAWLEVGLDFLADHYHILRSPLDEPESSRA